MESNHQPNPYKEFALPLSYTRMREWCAHEEFNLDPRLRRAVSYALNDGRMDLPAGIEPAFWR